MSVDIFHVGPPKTATTWVYQCMKEHPEVAVTARDTVHYYDMFYSYGEDWYEKQFATDSPDLKRLDATPSYIQSAKAIERLTRENPQTKIIICLRDPVERAFSHYWHLKKKGEISYRFDKILDNYTLFSLWLEPGLFSYNLQLLMRNVPAERIHVMHYEQLEKDSSGALRKLFRFCEVDENFVPSVLNERVNVAGPRQTLLHRIGYKLSKGLFGTRVDQGAGGITRLLSGKKEYFEGVTPELRRKLAVICEPEIAELERLLEVDLSAWRQRNKGEKAE